MQVGEQLGPDRYLQVAYEDLVEKPLEVLDKVAVLVIIIYHYNNHHHHHHHNHNQNIYQTLS